MKQQTIAVHGNIEEIKAKCQELQNVGHHIDNVVPVIDGYLIFFHWERGEILKQKHKKALMEQFPELT